MNLFDICFCLTVWIKLKKESNVVYLLYNKQTRDFFADHEYGKTGTWE